jgi:ankyrin repeat protein
MSSKMNAKNASGAELLSAIRAKDAEAAKAIIEKSSPAWNNGSASNTLRSPLNASNNSNYTRQTPLILACLTEQPEIAILLLEKGADPTAVDSDRTTPLHAACARGLTEVVQMLLDRGADPSALRTDGVSPLHLAIRMNLPDIVRLLLEHGSDPNASPEPYVRNFQRGANKRNYAKAIQSPLRLAINRKHWDLAILLLKKGAAPPKTFDVRDAPPELIEELGANHSTATPAARRTTRRQTSRRRKTRRSRT